jgi:hypothetical protein
MSQKTLLLITVIKTKQNEKIPAYKLNQTCERPLQQKQ